MNISLQFHKLLPENLEELNSSVKETLRKWNDSMLTWYEYIQVIKQDFPKISLFISSYSSTDPFRTTEELADDVNVIYLAV